MVDVDFSPYLTFVCNSPRYQETLSRYTATDASHLVLEAQTVVREEKGSREREEQRQQGKPFCVLKELPKYAANHVLLSGKPGSGKSTTLKRLLLEMAEVNLTPQPPLRRGEGEQDFSESFQTPLLDSDPPQPPLLSRANSIKVPLFKGDLGGSPGLQTRPTLSHREREIWGEGKIPVLVQLKSNRPILEAIRAEFRQAKLRVSHEQIDDWLLEGKLFLLLDGVNEIPSEELRRELQQFREDNPQTPMIFTTRDLAVGGDLGIEQKLEMRPLTETQMREFVGKYLPEYGEVLLRQLKDRLREVAETPLLLKMLCEVFDPQTQQIPKSKGELFRAFDQKYNQHKPNPPVSGDFRRFQSEVLQHLAFEMVRGDKEKPTEAWLTVSRSKAEGILEEWLSKRGVADAATKAKEWLEDLLEHHLLQVAVDPRRIEFHHQLFQEYYAAEALLARVETRHPDVMDDERLQHFYLNYLKWTEPVALMVALLEDEAQAVRVVRLALDVDLKLGARLAGEVKPEFQQATVGRVSALEIPEWLKAKLLGTTGSKAAIPGLLHALKNQDSDVRESAAWALGELDSEAGIPELLHALEDENSDVCLSAAKVLDELAGLEQPIVRLLKALEVDEDDSKRRSTAEASRTLSSDQALNDEDSDVRRSAVEALGRSGSPEAIPGLLHALTDKDYWVRRSAVEALGKIGSPEAIPGLLQTLEHEDSDVRESAVEALGKIGLPAAIPGLLHALTDKDYWVRRSAVEVLGKIGSPEAIPGLLQTLEHEDSDVRESAVAALGKISSPEAIPGLLHALTDKDSDVRWSAFEALGQIKQDNAPQILPDLLALIPKSRPEVLWAISDIQQNCQFYNYEMFRKQLPPVVRFQPSTDDSMLKALQQINQGVKKMSETPKQDFSGATFNGHVNFASNHGSQDVTNIGTQNNYATDSNVEKALKSVSQLVDNLRQKYPQASDAEILDIITRGFETMPQNNPQKWQRWQDTLSVVFAGGIEGIKLFFPPAGIPIEVGKRLYEIYDRNRKQLPSS